MSLPPPEGWVSLLPVPAVLTGWGPRGSPRTHDLLGSTTRWWFASSELGARPMLGSKLLLCRRTDARKRKRKGDSLVAQLQRSR
jgi:hypothetical protein